MKLIFLYIIFY